VIGEGSSALALGEARVPLFLARADRGPIIKNVSDELINALKDALTRHEDVVAAYLFGSAARGELRDTSDVDVGVLVLEPPGGRSSKGTLASMRFPLQADLQESARRPVDLVVLNHASPDLVHRVLRDGVLLLERDRSARIRFEVASRNEYFDILPYLKRYREAALR
jgi:predicted nucleotidyltransferase